MAGDLAVAVAAAVVGAAVLRVVAELVEVGSALCLRHLPVGEKTSQHRCRPIENNTYLFEKACYEL